MRLLCRSGHRAAVAQRACSRARIAVAVPTATAPSLRSFYTKGSSHGRDHHAGPNPAAHQRKQQQQQPKGSNIAPTGDVDAQQPTHQHVSSIDSLTPPHVLHQYNPTSGLRFVEVTLRDILDQKVSPTGRLAAATAASAASSSASSRVLSSPSSSSSSSSSSSPREFAGFERCASKQELLGLTPLRGVAARDLRPVDVMLSGSAAGERMASITVHPRCFIVALGHVRAIVAADRVLVFDAETPDARNFLRLLGIWLRKASQVDLKNKPKNFMDSTPSPTHDAKMLTGDGSGNYSDIVQTAMSEVALEAGSRAGQADFENMLNTMVGIDPITGEPRLDDSNGNNKGRANKSKANKEREQRQIAQLTPIFSSDGFTYDMPFEFVVLECILLDVWRALSTDYNQLEPLVLNELDRMMAAPETPMTTLLNLRKRLAKQEKEIADNLGLLRMLWSNDSDMSSLYLTHGYVRVTSPTSSEPTTTIVPGKGVEDSWTTPAMREAVAWGGANATHARPVRRRRQDEHEEVEVLLETYMKQFQRIAQDLHELQNSIQATEEYVSIYLDSTRNRIMRFSLLLSMGTFSVTTCGLTAAVFGMNLPSGLEQHPVAFHYAVGGIVTGSALLFALTVLYARNRRAW